MFAYLSKLLTGPVLLAVVPALKRAVVHVDAVRQGDQKAEHPDDCDDEQTSGQLHARLERVDDDEEAIDGDRGERQCGDVHACALSVGN